MAETRWTQLDFARQRPFASFLPGIAGPLGTPLWVFTVNRGQAIAALGVGSKDNAIVEFQPASRAWLDTERTGFRTFVRLERAGGVRLHEPFGPADATTLTTDLNTLALTARNEAAGLGVEVRYCLATGEPYAALVRMLTLRNTGPDAVAISLLDGLARVLPFGVTDGLVKGIGRTVEAWMTVDGADAGVPFFRLLASTGDAAEVAEISAGHYLLSPGAARILVDPTVVFGSDTGLGTPRGFADLGPDGLQAAAQATQGRTPCAFALHRCDLAPGEERTFVALVGHARDHDEVVELHDGLGSPDQAAAWARAQWAAAERLGVSLTDPVASTTANPAFDAYARQTYLDNVLRGGEPIEMGGRVLHLYGRKHGDLERDYNAFSLPPTPLSEGNANYRDLNQNRRSDVLFHPWVGATNVLDFLGALGLDGYNPLVLLGRRFRLDAAARLELGALTSGWRWFTWPEEFVPGALLVALEEAGQDPAPVDLLAAALDRAEPVFATEFAEGYWADHWIYNLDQLEAYRAVFPDRWAALLATPVGYAAASGRIPGRDERYVLTPRGVRQYAQVTPRAVEPPDVHVSVFAKLLGLAAIKAATLDPAGIGLEMEGGKPGWYDALNGLPGLLGSSLGEVRQLRRLLRLLAAAVAAGDVTSAVVPVEVADLIAGVVAAALAWADGDVDRRDLSAWVELGSLRDGFRARTAAGVSGETVELTASELGEVLGILGRRIDAAVEASAHYPVGTMYLRFDVTAWDEIGTTDTAGRPYVRPRAFAPVALPVFLEGAVHALVDSPERAAEIHAEVCAGELYDEALRMFRVNASLQDQTHEIGRARAFAPGWLENASIWLHMEYKYLLGLLRAGEFAAFHAAFADAAPYRQEAARYGRSPLENVSFLVSSAHPDPRLHGAGYVARLSGATAEFCSMWHLLMAGPTPFVVENGELVCRLRPALPGAWFDANGEVTFTFVGAVPVVVANPRRVDTWTAEPAAVAVVVDGEEVLVGGGDLRGDLAHAVRAGRAGGVRLSY
ncbi:hypothetical protein [Propioniciclava sp.]|uniref:hypothetical protein n=1 Tax=Propioniciclava sp. TaxID=2038686 RepID=UPI00262DE21E|nr:hypothetical protein [Propioniciclava sp.]